MRISRPTVLAAAVVAVVAALALPASGLGVQGTSDQACQLSVFSWWTGGGEAAGLDRLIKIWNRQNPDCQFKNETVAGGAGSNAKAVLAQRLAAGNPPDSFQGHAGAELRDYIKAGQVLPVDFIYRQAGFGKSMPASLLSQIRYQGKIYSVPVNIHRANVLWFNPRTLRSNGITVPRTWGQFMTALQKAEDAGLTPLAMGEQWTAKHLLETVMIGALGPKGWAALWRPGSASKWSARNVTAALNRYNAVLEFTNSDAGSLTWQEAGKLVADGKAAFNIMGDWQDGYFSGTKKGGNLALKPGTGYGWAPVPGTDNVYDWLSDSFTLPKGAPHRAAAVKWLTFLGSRLAQDTFNPVKGSIPARKDANTRLYGPYLKTALRDWKSDALAGSLAHGVVASNAWNADIDTALGLFLQNKSVSRFQTALVAAAKKNAK
ncbi:MAG: ABC transporter substrate-binding protein [Gaiellaceae bacterium]